MHPQTTVYVDYPIVLFVSFDKQTIIKTGFMLASGKRHLRPFVLS